MNPLDRIPGPRGDHDGVDVWHVIGTLFGIGLVVVVLIAVGILLWNSFKVRSELRTLRGEVALLRGVELPGGGDAATQAKPMPAPADGLAVPPTPKTSAATAAAPAMAVPPTAVLATAVPTAVPTAAPTAAVPEAAATTTQLPKVAAPKAPRSSKKKPADSAD